MADKVVIQLDLTTPAGLRQAREDTGLSIDLVALRAGVDSAWLSRAERALVPMSPDRVKAVGAAISAILDERGAQR